MPGGHAQPPGRDKIAKAPPPGLTTSANAPRLPGGGGGGMGTAGIDLSESRNYGLRVVFIVEWDLRYWW